MPRKNTIKKNNTKQKQSQRQSVVVNINQPSRRRQQKSNSNSSQQRSSAPQVITIPYPVMQQQTPQQFNRPSIAIPSQSFESNFKNLSDQINNLSNRFNTQTMVTPSVVTQPLPQKAENRPVTTPSTVPIVYPENAIDIEYSREKEIPVRAPKTPVVQGVKDLIQKSLKVYPSGTKNDEYRIITYPAVNNSKFDDNVAKSLFTSPSLNVDSRQFNKPKVVIPEINNNPVFNQPNLIVNEPPSEQFNEELIQEDEAIILNDNKKKTCPFCKDGIDHKNNFKRHILTNHYDSNLQSGETGTSYNSTLRKEYTTYPMDKLFPPKDKERKKKASKPI